MVVLLVEGVLVQVFVLVEMFWVEKVLVYIVVVAGLVVAVAVDFGLSLTLTDKSY